MKLQFGVRDIPYAARYTAQSPLTPSMKRRRATILSPQQRGYGQGKTTGQVATELEKRYGIMETFFGFEENFIVENFEKAYAEGTTNGMNLGPWDVKWDPFPLENRFARTLTGRKFDGVIKGVPTQAAQRGVSHLRRNPYTPRAPRPSFVDTSLYQRSFTAWLEP
jgi:hypothetical protein